MTQIIKTSTPGKERERLSKAIVITIRNFMRQATPDKETQDMVAFIILALKEISAGIELSVAAWEKRGYWVKADKYRLEWQWAGEMSKKLENAFDAQEWPAVATLLLEIIEKFSNIKVSDRHRMGKPWQGALKEYKNSPKNS
ncbi:MAG: hypothetical protein ACNA70_00250 [Brevefilum sp.]